MNLVTKLVFMVMLFSLGVQAQNYKINALDIDSNGSLQAVSISPNGRYLLFTETISENFVLCDWLFDRQSNSKQSMCELGMAYTLAVNDKGSVLGATSFDTQSSFAVFWSAAEGLTKIYDPSDATTSTTPVALDVHDRVYAVADRSVTYTVGTPPDITSTSEYDSPRALVWSKAGGSRLLFPNDTRANIVLAASNSGKLVVQRATQEDPSADTLRSDAYFQLEMASYIKLPKLKLRHLPHSNFRHYYANYFLSDLIATSAISDKSDDVIVEGNRFIKARRRVQVAKRYAGQRSDALSNVFISSHNNVVGVRGLDAFIDSATIGAIELSCLTPQNRRIEGANNLTPRTMSSFRVGGVTNNDIIFMSADIEADGRYTRLFLVEPNGNFSAPLSESIDYCPTIELTELPKDGTELKYKITVKSGGRIYPGFNLKLVAHDTDINSIDQDTCPEIDLGHLTTDSTGSARMHFTSKPFFDYEIRYASPSDQRFALHSFTNYWGGQSVYYGNSYDGVCTKY